MLKSIVFNFNYSEMSTKSKYIRQTDRQEKEKADKPDTDIIMQRSDFYGRYVGRALKLFFEDDKKFVTIKAAERVIERAIWVAEVLKKKVGGLHQITRLTENKIVDVYEPKEEGLLKVEVERFLTVIEITLTKEPTAEQKKEAGYQAPLKLDEKDLLTKEKWALEQKEREQKREDRKAERDDREKRRGEEGERRERRSGERRRNEDREERGGERRRGRNTRN